MVRLDLRLWRQLSPLVQLHLLHADTLHKNIFDKWFQRLYENNKKRLQIISNTDTNYCKFQQVWVGHVEQACFKQNKPMKLVLITTQISNETCLIALVMSTCFCDSLLLLLLLLLLLIIKLSELHQPNLGQPRVLTLALQGSRSWPRFVRVEVGRCQRKEPKG